MFAVARVSPVRANEPRKKVRPARTRPETRSISRPAHLLGHPGIDGAFVARSWSVGRRRSARQPASVAARRGDKSGRFAPPYDRRWNGQECRDRRRRPRGAVIGDDERRLGEDGPCPSRRFGHGLRGAPQFATSRGSRIANRFEAGRKRDGERQPDIAEADDRYPRVVGELHSAPHRAEA